MNRLCFTRSVGATFAARLGPRIRQAHREKGFLSELIENVKKEASKDEELSKSVQKIEDRLTDVKENPALKAVKDGLSKAKKGILDSNAVAIKELKETASKVQESAAKANQVISEYAEPVKKVGRIIVEKNPIDIQKIAENEGVKKVAENIVRAQETIVDEADSYRYGGFVSKNDRERLKQQREAAQSSATPPFETVAENPEAGERIVLHKSSQWLKKWKDFKEDNVVLRGIFDMKRTYDESNNIFIYYMRSITSALGDTFGSMFSDNERAQVVKEIRTIDPNFTIEGFLKEAREFIIPEILEASLNGDLQTLRPWCGEAVFNVFKATFDVIVKSGVRLEGSVIDMRGLDVHTAKLLDDHPVLVVTFHTQQTQCARNLAGEVVEGNPDQVKAVAHVWALAKVGGDLDVGEKSDVADHTNGWRLIEMASRDGSGGI